MGTTAPANVVPAQVVNSVWVTYSQAVLTPIAQPAPITVDYAATTGITIPMSKFFTIAKGATANFSPNCARTIIPTTLPNYHGAHWIEGDISSTSSVFTIVTTEPTSGPTNQLGVGQSIFI